jgi:thiamine pyrophosphokinase
MSFKTKYGHCDVSYTGDDASLGKWCNIVRGSYKKMQNNQKHITKLSDEQIQRLSDEGFKWSLRKGVSGFDKNFNDLVSFKSKHGHCDVSHRGEDASLGQWCNIVRGSYKKMQNNQKPITKLSDEQIQRLSDAGFKWSLRKGVSVFDKNFNDLMSNKSQVWSL